LLPRGLRVISLGTKNLLSEQFGLTSRDGTVYTEVNDRGALTADTYFVDYENGLLYLDAAIQNDQVRVSFQHRERQAVSGVKIWYQEGRPVGLVLPRTTQLINGTDEIGGSLRQRISRRGRPETVTDPFPGSTNAKQLSFENVVRGSVVLDGVFTGTPKEIEYRDGHSEFLGLISVTDEQTVEIEASGLDTTVQFALAAGALVWLETGVSFDSSLFTTLVGTVGAVNSAGEYFIDPTDGTVTVYVGLGGTLPGGIQITYLYRDSSFNPDSTFSVDYRRGILYGGSDFVTGGTITYKASDILVGYDVAAPVTSSYDPVTNTVEVKTETLHPQNNLVKTL